MGMLHVKHTNPKIVVTRFKLLKRLNKNVMEIRVLEYKNNTDVNNIITNKSVR